MKSTEYKNHPIWATLLTLDERHASLPDVLKGLEQYEAARKALDFVRWILENNEPWLVGKSELDQSNSELAQANQHLLNAKSDASYFTHFDQALAPFMQRFGSPRRRRYARGEASAMLTVLAGEVARIHAATADLFAKVQGADQTVAQVSRDIKKAHDEFQASSSTTMASLKSEMQQA